MEFSLGALAERLGVRLAGDGDCRISGVAPLDQAVEGQIAFLTSPRYRQHLSSTGASAVILNEALLADCPVHALVTDNPHLVYARVARLLFPLPEVRGGVHPRAVVDPAATLDPSAWVGPGAVIEADARVDARVFIGPNCVIGAAARIGEDSRLEANVTICHGVEIGRRVQIQPGAVVGADGFGLANDQGVWERVPQLGGVRVGDDVEIGANTTVDRGALQDTVLERGAKLDNLIQIAHNVEIGEHSALAACVGIAGSTRVGRHCTLGGGVGLAGHLEFADNVHFSGMSLVTRSFSEPGYYSGNLPAMDNRSWRKIIARLRRLDELTRRVSELENKVSAEPQEGADFEK